MSIKPGVDLRGLQPQMALAYTIACAVYAKVGGYECVITSASDGVHGPNSLHYKGLALDLRTKHVDDDSKVMLLHTLKAAMGAQFDVILESIGEENEHAHLEFQPKDTPKGEV